MSAADQHPLRLTPLPADEWNERARAAVASLIPRAGESRWCGQCLVDHGPPPRPDRGLPAVQRVPADSLDAVAAVREVALLRVVHHSKCGYLWSHHLPIAARAGLSESEIDDIRSGTCADPTDQAVIRAVDDLTADSTVGQATWDELCRLFTQPQCMDLVFTIGGYLLLALAVNTFGVQEEHG